MKGVYLFNAGVAVHAPQRLGGNPHAFLAPIRIDDRGADQVRLELALGVALRVGHVVPRHRLLSSNRTNFRHDSTPGRGTSHAGRCRQLAGAVLDHLSAAFP